MTGRPLAGRNLLIGALLAAVVVGLAGVQALLSYAASPQLVLGGAIALSVAGSVAYAPMLGIYATVLAVPLEVLDLSLGSFGLTPSESLAIITAGASAFVLVRGSSAARVDAAHIAFAVGLFVLAAGLTIAVDPFTTTKILVMWSAFLVISMFIALRASVKEIERIVLCLAMSAGAVGAIALLGTGSQEAANGGAVVSNRAVGSFSHPNQLAFFLVLGLPCALASALHSRAATRWLLIAAIALAAGGLVLTLTRSAMIGAFVSLGILATWPRFRRVAGVALVALLAYVAINPSIVSGREVSLVATRLSTVTQLRDTQGNSRLEIYSRTPAIIADHPFLGVGAGNFPQYSIRYGLSEGGEAFSHAHNVFLTLGAELGLLGLIAGVWFVLAVSRRALAVLRNRRSPTYPSGIALVAALAGVLVTSVTDYPVGSNPVLATIMIEVGALIRLARFDE